MTDLDRYTKKAAEALGPLNYGERGPITTNPATSEEGARRVLEAVLPDIRHDAAERVRKLGAVVSELRRMMGARDEWTKGYVRALEQIGVDLRIVANEIEATDD